MADQGGYAAIASLLTGALALLYGFVWRFQRLHWAGWFSAAFALVAIRFLLHPLISLVPGQSPWVAAVFICPHAVCMTWAMASYTGLPDRWARLIKPVALAVAAATAVVILTKGLPVAVAMPMYAAYILVWATMAWWARRREAHSAHGVVVLALLVFPMAVISARLGGIESWLLPYLAVTMLAITGMTILTTGVLRAHRQIASELQGRLAAEESLKLLNESLERRVTERTDELQRLVSALESFNRSVSHDLRGPLGGIGSLANLAQTALEQHDLDAVARVLPAISRQAQASTELVSALLVLAQVGEAPLHRQTIDLNQLLQQLLSDMMILNPAWSAVRVQPELPSLDADPDLLRQLLINLIGNALKFSADRSTPHVEVGAELRQGECVLFVSDNGVGLSQDQIGQLFQPFRRVHGAHFQGHGVGLSIVKRVVDRHQGRIWVQAAPGEGAQFYFTLQPQTGHSVTA